MADYASMTCAQLAAALAAEPNWVECSKILAAMDAKDCRAKAVAAAAKDN